MTRSIAVTLALMGVLPALGHAQVITAWGKYDQGAYPLADEAVRFYAFSYVGDLRDQKLCHAKVNEAIGNLNREDKTHEWKDGNGNFNELTLGKDKVFVIGWSNPKRNTYGFLATVPGTASVVTNEGTVFHNTGWLREKWVVNGTDVFLQFGNNRGKVQWSLGHAR